MKIISIFALGILLGTVLGFIIFMNTPLISRYGMVTFAGFLIKYNTWDGKASIMDITKVAKVAMKSEEVWVPISDKQGVTKPEVPTEAPVKGNTFDELLKDIEPVYE